MIRVIDSHVLFADGATINSESLLTVDNPAILQPDGLYAVTINNPSKVSDLTVEFLNITKMKTPASPVGGVDKISSLAVTTIPKTADGLRDTHTKIVQGLFMGDSLKISVKNATALTANQTQTWTRNAIAFSAGKWTASVVAVDGTTKTTAELDWDIDNTALSAALTTLVGTTAGYTGSTVQVTGGSSKVFKEASAVLTLTFNANSTVIVPLLSFTNVSLVGAGTVTIAQGAVGAIRVPIQIRKV